MCSAGGKVGLDYFGARYYSGAQGRFTSPDEPLFDQYAGDPQSWNLYTYARNNPLQYIDPTGRGCVVVNGQDVDDPSVPGQTCAEARTPQQVTVSGSGGNAVTAVLLNMMFALSNSANNYFRPLTDAMGVQPAYMQNIPLSESGAGTTAMAAVFLVDFVGTRGGSGRLISAALRPGRGGLLTKVGHALQKHAGRSGSAFPRALGPEAAWNQKGLEVLKEIIENPQTIAREIEHPRYGKIVEVVDPTGRGARFSSDLNSLIGFIEP